jgi:hypothetical protein
VKGIRHLAPLQLHASFQWCELSSVPNVYFRKPRTTIPAQHLTGWLPIHDLQSNASEVWFYDQRSIATGKRPCAQWPTAALPPIGTTDVVRGKSSQQEFKRRNAHFVYLKIRTGDVRAHLDTTTIATRIPVSSPHDEGVGRGRMDSTHSGLI